MRKKTRQQPAGFTLLELLVAIAILAILALAAIPAFSVWLPKYKLKSAAQDLYSHMQSTKLSAIRKNAVSGISFYAGPDRYRHTGSGTARTVTLSAYGHGINFDGPGGETFDSAYLDFDARGFSNGGYAYLSNDKQSDYFRIGTLSTGVVRLQKWDGGAWVQ